MERVLADRNAHALVRRILVVPMLVLPMLVLGELVLAELSWCRARNLACSESRLGLDGPPRGVLGRLTELFFEGVA